MGKYRKRFNEKARTGMLAKQASLKKARQKQFHRDEVVEEHKEVISEPQDTNAEILKPMTDEEKKERKRKLESELYTENKDSKFSKAKKKRLDKYIEHQLKREEKQILFKKLEGTKMDTSLLKPSKLLGSGKQTRREDMVEALELERQGRGDERTKEILYEEREVRDWEEDYGSMEKPAATKGYDSSEDDEQDDMAQFGETNEFVSSESKSSFVDNRPAKFGGAGFGFGFQDLKKVEKKSKPKSYSWRLKVEKEEKKRNRIDDENDFLSSSEDEEDGSDEELDEDEDLESGESDGEIDTEEGVEIEHSEIEDDEEDDDDEEDEEDDDEDDEDDEEEEKTSKYKPKHSKKAESFKEWAEQQVRVMEGRDGNLETPILDIDYKPTTHDEDLVHSDDDENYIPINKEMQRDAFFVDVMRSNEIQNTRIQLPVFGEEHRIMEAIHHHDCIVICGETGSGKTTQVPQFLFEAGYGSPDGLTPGMIGVTQPRRVAAVSMAERVGKELGNFGHKVGYQIRFDATTKSDTALKFMTDGVLLREMMTDFMLTKYSCIIIDEAHERNINTDILIGMLSRILKLRKDYHTKDSKKYTKLKLIIMSATLRVSDFSENKLLFNLPPPILKVDARQYPVAVHFNRRTSFNYLEESFKKACKVHQKLPPGGILIFLTGQSEITDMVKRLRNEFPFPDEKKRKTPRYEEDIAQVKISAKRAVTEVEDIDFGVEANFNEEHDDYVEDSEEEEGFDEVLEDHQTDRDPLYVLPLYSLLPTKEQMKVFDTPPPGSRLCIVATNVAETSLTIPGIRYVIDAGRSKERKFNEETGVQSFEVSWVSKASADQRAGRAGRTGPGHCYRLFSSAVYENDFAQFAKPEILRMPVESVVLTMKSMGIDNIVNFPFPTPPDRLALSKAEKLLQYLGAINKDKLITELGKTMSLFPLSPRFAKMLIVGNQHNCLPYIVAIVSALSVGDPFINENEVGIAETRSNGNEDDSEEEQESYQDQEAKRKLKSKFYKSRGMFSRLDPNSDVLKILSAVCALDHVPDDKKNSFLRDNFLRQKSIEEIGKLRKQIVHIVKVNTTKDGLAVSVDKSELKLGVPTKQQVTALKQMVTAGFIDQIAIRADKYPQAEVSIPNKSNKMSIPYVSLFPSTTYGEQIAPHVYIHPSSIILDGGVMPPEYLVYQSLNLGTARPGKLPKLRMKPLTSITGKALINIGKGSGLVTYSKPLGPPYAPKLINSEGTKRICYVVPRFGAAIGDGGVGWDMASAIEVTQNKVNGQWIIE